MVAPAGTPRWRMLAFGAAIAIVACGQKEPPSSFTNSLGMKMMRIEPPSEPREGEPLIAYYISATEVTNEQFERFQGGHRERRPYDASDQQPATQVSFNEARDFARWLSTREGILYRLPSEAQWDWAARAGDRDRTYGTADGTLSHELANYGGQRGRDRWDGAAPVASFPPNPWGLFDMTGNVWEWCAAWYHQEDVPFRVSVRSKYDRRLEVPAFWFGPWRKYRVLRGGSHVHDEPLLRLDVRNGYKAGHRSPSWGFRLVSSGLTLVNRR